MKQKKLYLFKGDRYVVVLNNLLHSSGKYRGTHVTTIHAQAEKIACKSGAAECLFIPGLTFAFRSVLAHSAIMEVRALGGDDFGISPEGLQAVAEAMAKVSADSEEHHSDSDIWNGVKEMLYHTAAFVDAAGTDKDAVAAYCFRSLLKATSTYNDEQTPKLLQHPKYADQLLIQCWVPAFGDSSQRSLRWAYALATELRYARKYLRVLVWLLSRAPGRTRESTWAKLSYNWLLQAETAMLQKRQNGLTAS